MEFLKNLDQVVAIQIGVVFLAAWLLIALAQRALPWVANRLPGRYRLLITATIPGIRLIIILSAIVLIISRVVKPTFESLIALLGAAGLALGFAFKDYASSLIAGIVSLYEMPYRIGDWISIDGAYGEVKSINMRNIEITTPDDTVVVIPNLKLWNTLIFNANDGSQNLQCAANFYLHPRHDSTLVMHALNDVGLTSSYLQIKKPIHVVVQEKPWGTHYRIKAYPVAPSDQFRFITDLTVRGKAVLTKLGVEFAITPAAHSLNP